MSIAIATVLSHRASADRALTSGMVIHRSEFSA